MFGDTHNAQDAVNRELNRMAQYYVHVEVAFVDTDVIAFGTHEFRAGC